MDKIVHFKSLSSEEIQKIPLPFRYVYPPRHIENISEKLSSRSETYMEFPPSPFSFYENYRY